MGSNENINENIDNIYQAEFSILEKEFLSDSQLNTELKKILPKLNRQILEANLRYKYNCPNVMTAIAKIIKGIISKYYTENIQLDKWITDLVQIGVPSTEGIALTGGIRFVSNALVVKISNNPKSNTLVHEYFVGSVLNTLRNATPNFMYVFSGLSCNLPTLNNQKQLIGLCSQKGTVKYLISEFVDGSPLEKLIIDRVIDTDRLIKIILQILLALNVAWNKYNFVHQDLHLKNILVRRLRQETIFSYPVFNEKDPGKSVYIISDYLPVIIDYGLSRLSFEGQDFGVSEMPEYGISIYEKHPGIDIYKLLYSTISVLTIYNIPDKDKFTSVFRPMLYIMSETQETKNYLLDQNLGKFINFGYPYKNDSGMQKITVMNVFKFLEENNPEILIPLESVPRKGFVNFLEKCFPEKGDSNDIFLELFSPPKSGPCSGNDWKGLNHDFKDIYGKQRYWFDCGKFIFDGLFNIVEFPEGMSLYHGSLPLSYYNNEYPLGLEYYSTEKNENKNKLSNTEKGVLKNPKIPENEKKKILKSKQPVGISYYGEYSSAVQYSSMGKIGEITCGGNCINAFILTKKIKMVNLYDPFNLYVLLTHDYIGEKARNLLAKKYNIGTIDNFIDLYEKISLPKGNVKGRVDISSQPFEQLQQAFTPFKRFILKSKRSTLREDNYLVPREIIKVFNELGYSGFVNPKTPSTNNEELINVYLSELVFGENVLEFISRDFSNPLDWQYVDNSRLFGEIGKLVLEYQKYKTTNIDFHQGDLYQHSIWTALFTQKQFDENSPWVQGILPTESQMLIMAGFLHDIGKAGDLVYTFYDKQDHPERGYEYLIGEKKFYYLDPKGKNGEKGKNVRKVLDIPELLRNVNISRENVLIIAFIIKTHWEFGNAIKELHDNLDNLLEIAEKYKNYLDRNISIVFSGKIKRTEVREKLYRYAMLISVCDIMGSSVYIDTDKFVKLSEKLRNDPGLTVNNLNTYLRNFPYLTNKPKNHRGSDNYTRFNVEKKGMAIRDKILLSNFYYSSEEYSSSDNEVEMEEIQ